MYLEKTEEFVKTAKEIFKLMKEMALEDVGSYDLDPQQAAIFLNAMKLYHQALELQVEQAKEINSIHEKLDLLLKQSKG